SSWGAFTVVGDSGLRVPLVRPAWWRSAWTWASGLSPILLAAGFSVLVLGAVGVARKRRSNAATVDAAVHECRRTSGTGH
ncbi:MAG: hypothetical protein PVJ02_14110, partial [Gemmatimonadota bacterium]